MNKTLLIILIAGFAILMTYIASANNIQVSNVTLTGQNTAAGFTYVQFDLTWENSWRTSTAPNNWDAAWVFVKYRVNGGEWLHARLNIIGHSAGTGTAAIIQSGLIDEASPFDISSNPAVGAFFYRSGDGTGTFALSGARLRWNYSANGLTDTDQVDVKVFAIEMVYVAPGNFYLGSGGSERSAFYTYPTVTSPYLVTGEQSIAVGAVNGNLYYASGFPSGDQSGPLPATYPKGYAGFYSMKYEISQQQYVDFLNTLQPAHAAARFSGVNTNRNAVTYNGTQYQTSNPYVANNQMSWNDASAYADWAGLRPMTELEFEKACRGPLYPVPNEFAWGTAAIAPAQAISNAGASNETIPTPGANAIFANLPNVQGPVRVGIFGTPATNRIQASSSYWGVPELSGNLWEIVISSGNPAGRSFTGIHGNGAISAGSHDVATWPSPASGTGSSFRGSGWSTSDLSAMVSDRVVAANDAANRDVHHGARLIRSLPLQDFVCGGSTISDIDENVYPTVQIGTQCWMKQNLKVSKNPGGTAITKYCYNNTASNCNLYGALYDWSTVMNGASGSNSNPSGVQGICMDGWHVPGHDEWLVLTAYLGGESVAGGKLKSTRSQPTAAPSWYTPNTGATDESGFSAIPGGYNSGPSYYNDIPYVGYWWTTTDTDINTARARYLNYSTAGIVPGYTWNKSAGFSLRCIKNL